MENKIRYKYNDVYDSPYDYDDLYVEFGKLKFYFSSSTGLERFVKRLPTSKDRVSKWFKVFNISEFILDNLIAYIYTYEIVEKRGFRVELENDESLEVFKCHKEMMEMLNLIYSKKLD